MALLPRLKRGSKSAIYSTSTSNREVIKALNHRDPFIFSTFLADRSILQVAIYEANGEKSAFTLLVLMDLQFCKFPVWTGQNARPVAKHYGYNSISCQVVAYHCISWLYQYIFTYYRRADVEGLHRAAVFTQTWNGFIYEEGQDPHSEDWRAWAYNKVKQTEICWPY